MSAWDANELERRTAARLSVAGFVPALNVVHLETQSEFDVYGIRLQPDAVSRLMVQCSVPSPNATKLMALRGYAWCFGVEACLLVSVHDLHEDQQALAELAQITVLSEEQGADFAATTLHGIPLSAHTTLTPREEAIARFLRCMAWLRRIALDCRRQNPTCEQVVQTWRQLDGIALLPDPFERLCALYEIHGSNRRLAEECALSEGLATTGRDALKQAYAYNQGTYTQSALAVQTLNRIHTIITLAECACLVAGGRQVPPVVYSASSNAADEIVEFSRHPARHLLAWFVFEFLYGWGGFWQEFNIDPFREDIAQCIGASPEQVDEMIALINRVFGTQQGGEFVVSAGWSETRWRNLTLLPYFAKGIGVRRIEDESGLTFDDTPWREWKISSLDLERDLRQWETSHPG